MAQAIGQNIKKLREEQGATQDSLAAKLRLTYQAVSKWENGASLPDIALLPDIAAFFGVTIDELFKPNMRAYPNLAHRYMSEYESFPSDETFSKATREFEKLREEGTATDHDVQFYAYTLENRVRIDAERAEELYNEAIEMGREKKDGQFYKTQAMLLDFLAWLGRHDENIEKHRAIVAQEPDDLETHLALIFAYRLAGRYTDARDAVAAAALRFPDKDKNGLTFEEGNIAFDEEKFSEAEGLYDRALAAGNKRVLFYKRNMLAQQGRFTEAAEIGYGIADDFASRGLEFESRGIRKHAAVLAKLAAEKAESAEKTE
ncbi:MAG: helix-turn-helix domain-containing protein [Oscillospiraceae bacterium]|jgi:transcriptional regulator with XRE-family HTH domain|nr:helix-turn-helix domain-containing protein [Oscillospiraceae bacterium]